MKSAVIVTAAGSSSRFNSGIKKEFSDLNGHSVLYNAVKNFTLIEDVSVIVITYREGTLDQTKTALENLTKHSKIVFVKGGETRQASVFNGLKEIADNYSDVKFVAIHDGARPFASLDLIEKTFEKAFRTGGAAPAVLLRDTLVISNEDGLIVSRADRNILRAVQTPQIFAFPDIYLAHKKALTAEKKYTDDTEIFSDYGKHVYLVQGDNSNIKITFAEDIKK